MTVDSNTNFISSLSGKRSKYGAAIHNAAYENLNVNFIYVPFAVNNIKDAVAGLKAMSFTGSAVSMPYKQEVMKHLDEIDETAQKIGAVNVIHNRYGRLKGHNSDWVGAIDSLKEITELKNKKVLLVGAGGVARAIAYGLKINDAEVVIFNRTFDKAKILAQEFNLKYDEMKNLENYDYDILINATPVGSGSFIGKAIVSEDFVQEGKIIMDVIANPTITHLLEMAQKKNCKIISGYRMLIYQAIFAIELWTGKRPEFDVMEEALLKYIE
jgi:shikimate dehydrogenase